MNNVAVLLSTYNGGNYLEEQLQSLKIQKNVKLTIFVIDDNSEDNTCDIIKKSNLKIHLFKSKGYRDPVKNFLYLIKKSPSNFDYYCFCDQDDYWLKNKLSYCIFIMKYKKADIVGSRTFITNKNLKIINISKKFIPSFKNSILQSIAGGNTLVWNNSFHNFLKNFNNHNPASHDWYLYQISLLYNFSFYFINKPTILYRQHGKNLVGHNLGLLNNIKRLLLGLRGRYRMWHEMNEDHLINVNLNQVNKKNYEIVKSFYFYRSQGLFKKKLNILFSLNIRRQNFLDNIFLFIAILLNKI